MQFSNYLNITVNDKGNLEITASPEGIEYLQEQVGERIISDPETTSITWKQNYACMWWDMLESYACNGSYSPIPEGILGLTDAPGISEERIMPEDGDDPTKYIVPDNLRMWYFPDYMVVSEFEKLLAGEAIVFVAVPVDKKEFKYTFQISRKIIFEVNYYTLGGNPNPHFATSAAQFNQPKTDFNHCGQAQDSLLPKTSRAFKFYTKWDHVHCQDLTDAQYSEMIRDIELLKDRYNYITDTRFHEQKKLSMLAVKKMPKKQIK